jgi:pilus assembly protein CpaE
MTQPQQPQYPQQAAAPAQRPMPMPVPQPMPRPMPVPGQGAQPGHMPQGVAPVPAQPGPNAPRPQMMPPTMPQGVPPMMPQGQAVPGYAPAMPHAAPASPMVSAPSAPLAQVMTQPVAVEDREGGEKALPQISIHAFCDRNETAACINEMTRDWRMRRANTKIYMGGLQAAIDFYHKENTPALIVIETGMRGPELFSQLETLASVCDEGTKVVIIGAANDIRLYRQLMDKGVSDYIVPPLHPLNLIRAISELYSDPETPFLGRAIAFFGAKGGVGSSTLAHNMAWVLAEHLQQDTSLIDLDSSWGTTALDFAYDSASGLEEALSEPERLDETLMDRIMVRHTAKLSLLPTSSSLNTKPVFDTEAYEAIVNAVRGISPLAILDVPHFWADWTTNVLTTVDDVVITATPDLANLRNTKNLIDFLRAQRPNDPDPILVLNKTGRCKNPGDEIGVDQFGATVGLEPSLVIGFDPDTFSRACNDGKMLSEMKDAAPIIPGLEYLGTRLRTGQFGTPSMAEGKRLMRKGSKKEAADGEKNKSLIGSLLKKKKG